MVPCINIAGWWQLFVLLFDFHVHFISFFLLVVITWTMNMRNKMVARPVCSAGCRLHGKSYFGKLVGSWRPSAPSATTFPRNKYVPRIFIRISVRWTNSSCVRTVARACVGIVVSRSFSASHSKHTHSQTIRKVLLLIVVELVMLYAACRRIARQI